MSDLISRADAIHAIEDLPNAYNGWSDTYDKACIIGVLEEVPSAEPKTGKWVKVIDEETLHATEWHYECDQCGAGRWKSGQRYCFNCGARMVREDGEA